MARVRSEAKHRLSRCQAVACRWPSRRSYRRGGRSAERDGSSTHCTAIRWVCTEAALMNEGQPRSVARRPEVSDLELAADVLVLGGGPAAISAAWNSAPSTAWHPPQLDHQRHAVALG